MGAPAEQKEWQVAVGVAEKGEGDVIRKAFTFQKNCAVFKKIKFFLQTA